MHKQDFLTALSDALYGLPQSDIEQSIEYYSEIIDDQMEDGISEEEAVASLGAPDAVAKQILMDTTLPKLVKAKVKPSRTLRAWEITLLILGSPIWASLLIAAVSVLLSLYITIWAVIVSLYAVDLTFAVGALLGLVQGGIFIGTGNVAAALFYLGAAIACFGLAVLSFFGFNKVTAKLIIVSKQFVLWMKSLFIRRRKEQ
ncbi:MAG: DUF1700 domain-containing protein [Clostridiales bacterium]|nr:DUF1700 domain-containing protein [Clostridiales bacterium]